MSSRTKEKDLGVKCLEARNDSRRTCCNIVKHTSRTRQFNLTKYVEASWVSGLIKRITPIRDGLTGSYEVRVCLIEPVILDTSSCLIEFTVIVGIITKIVVPVTTIDNKHFVFWICDFDVCIQEDTEVCLDCFLRTLGLVPVFEQANRNSLIDGCKFRKRRTELVVE